MTSRKLSHDKDSRKLNQGFLNKFNSRLVMKMESARKESDILKNDQ